MQEADSISAKGEKVKPNTNKVSGKVFDRWLFFTKGNRDGDKPRLIKSEPIIVGARGVGGVTLSPEDREVLKEMQEDK